MDHILAISQAILGTTHHVLSFSQILTVIQRVTIEIQKMKMIEAGRQWGNYDKLIHSPDFMEEATSKTIRAMINWDLLERKGEQEYFATNNLLKIGEYVSDKKEIEYRKHILESMLRNEPDLPFRPSRYLVPIRDFVLPSDFLSGLESLPVEEVFPRTISNVKNVLKVNMVDFDMMSVWGQFFNFTSLFNPKVAGIAGVRQVFLTCWIASLAELEGTYQEIVKNGEIALVDSKLNMARQALKHSVVVLEKLGWINVQQGVAQPRGVQHERIIGNMMKELEEMGAIVVLEDGEGSSSRERNLERNRVFVIFPREISSQEFKASLVKQYRFLTKRTSRPHVWISQLRAMCCRELGIQDDLFDRALALCYHEQPEAFEFSMIGGDVTRGKIRSFGKPFRLYNQTYRMLRLEDFLHD